MSIFEDLFDLDGDGEVSVDEEFITMWIAEECMRNSSDDCSDSFLDD